MPRPRRCRPVPTCWHRTWRILPRLPRRTRRGGCRRGGELAQQGAIVVKRCKPQQDLRFDLPAVGPKTIEVMASVKASALALEAGRSVLLDRDETVQKAERAGIAIVGLARI